MNIRLRRIWNHRGLSICCLLVILAVISYWVGRYKNVVLEQWITFLRNGEIAEVDAASLDFGETFVQEDFKWRLPIRNKSRRTLEIEGWRESCHCTEIEPRTLTIPPGEVREVTLTLNLLSKKNESEGRSEWDFAVMITPQIATLSFPADVWKVHGRVRATLACSPGHVDFGESLVFGKPFAAESVEVTSHQEIDHLEADWDRSFATVEVQPTTNDGRHFRVDVTPARNLALGDHTFMVTLLGKDSHGTTMEKAHCYVRANVVDDFVIAPSPVSFGFGEVGQLLEQTVSLTSRTQQPFSLLGAYVGDNSVAGIELTDTRPHPDGNGVVCRVRVRPLQAGVASFTMTFRVQQLEATPYDVALIVCYSALDAASKLNIPTNVKSVNYNE
jgi:hypothetical protein